MNKQQLTDLVIIPTLKEIPSGYSPEAVMASQMIVGHESLGGEYIAQTRGPALGIIQMEPLTHDDVWRYGDSIWKNAVLLGIITKYQRLMKKHPKADRLIYDLRYNIFMVRQKLFMDKEGLPDNAHDMSVYLKKNWNGDGKATPKEYLNDFAGWV
tara:strand:- start:4308 stop:4772 length:465 start_codon:yes stop_codon:yes gene_type:complete